MPENHKSPKRLKETVQNVPGQIFGTLKKILLLLNFTVVHTFFSKLKEVRWPQKDLV